MRSLITQKKHLLGLAITFVIGILMVPTSANASVGTAVISFFTNDALNGTFLWFLSNILIRVSGYWVQITAGLFDVSVNATMHIALLVKNTEAINLVWKIIRDFSSIFMIGVLIYASICTILGAEITGVKLGNVIKNIVIAGIFINFSLFGTKIIIDASNLAALSFYTAIKPNQNAEVSDAIMQRLKLQTYFGGQGFLNGIAPNGESFISKGILIGLGSVFVMVTVGFVFLAAAIAFMYRLVSLILCMAFSPFFFVAMVLPQTKDAREKFLDTLLTQSMVAPIFLMFLYFALQILSTATYGSGEVTTAIFGNGFIANTANFAAGGTGTIIAFFNLSIVIIIILGGLTAAQKSGAAGAGWALKSIASIQKWGLGALTKGAKWQANQVYGRSLSALSENNKLREMATSDNIVKSTLGTLTIMGARAGAKGFDENVKKKAEERAKFAESLGFDRGAVKELENQVTVNMEMHDQAQKLHTIAKVDVKSAEIALKEAQKEAKDAAKRGNPAEIADAARELATAQAAHTSAKDEAARLKIEVDKHKKDLTTAKGDVTTEKERRQENYSKNQQSTGTIISKLMGEPKTETGKFFKTLATGKSFTETAKAINKKLAESDIAEKKEELKKVQTDVKALQNTAKTAIGLTPEQRTELGELLDDEIKLKGEIRKWEVENKRK